VPSRGLKGEERGTEDGWEKRSSGIISGIRI
jgi:hypothetical protein